MSKWVPYCSSLPSALRVSVHQILPSIANAHPAVRNMAVMCLGMCALHSKDLAKTHMVLLLQVSFLLSGLLTLVQRVSALEIYQCSFYFSEDSDISCLYQFRSFQVRVWLLVKFYCNSTAMKLLKSYMNKNPIISIIFHIFLSWSN